VFKSKTCWAYTELRRNSYKISVQKVKGNRPLRETHSQMTVTCKVKCRSQTQQSCLSRYCKPNLPGGKCQEYSLMSLHHLNCAPFCCVHQNDSTNHFLSNSKTQLQKNPGDAENTEYNMHCMCVKLCANNLY